jgi:hypothetical protein
MRTRARLRLAGAALLPLLAACGGDARAAAPVVRDSAGVRIVESVRPAWGEGEGWRVSPEPLVDVGVAEGAPEYQFARVAGALRLDDGRIVVADGQANELRWFDAAGRHLKTAGRKGGGPGEFDDLHGLLRLPGDSVAAWEWSHRLSVFGPGGDFVRSRTLVPPRDGMFLDARGVFADGSVLVAPDGGRTFGRGAGVARDTVPLLRYAADGVRVDTVGRFPGQQQFSMTGTENGGWASRGPVPFGFDTFHALRGSLLYVADNARYEVAVHDASGRLLRLLRAPHRTEPLTPGEVERFKADRLAASGSGDFGRQVAERMLAAMPFPETKSAFAELRVDPAGAVWLRDHAARSDAPGRWTVFAEDGTLLGAVETPAGLRVLEIGADYVLGVWKDELDVQHVRLHLLQRDRGKP